MRVRLATLAVLLVLGAAVAAEEPAPFDVYGVRPGMTQEEVRALLGEPASVREQEGKPIWGYRQGGSGRPDPEVYWADDKVALVVGSRLFRGAEEAAHRGLSEAEVLQVLGAPEAADDRPRGLRLLSYGPLEVVVLDGKVVVFGLGEQP